VVDEKNDEDKPRFYQYVVVSFSVLALLVRYQEGHPAHLKNHFHLPGRLSCGTDGGIKLRGK